MDGDCPWSGIEGFSQDPSNVEFQSYRPLQSEDLPGIWMEDSDISSTNLPSSEPSDSSVSDRDLSEARRLGRRRLPETTFLQGYSTLRSHHPPKKENLRIQVYRGFVKLVEAVGAGKSRTQRINRLFEGADERAYGERLEELKAFLFYNWSEIQAILGHYRTPKVAGMSSYSDSFFSGVMETEMIHTAISLYVDFVFADNSERIMEQKLNLECYRGKLDDGVLSHWEKLQSYFKEQLFSDYK